MALNKQLVIARNVRTRKYLLYDEDIGANGLTWGELLKWYNNNHWYCQVFFAKLSLRK